MDHETKKKGKIGPFLWDNKTPIAKYTGLASLVALEAPIHETLHAVTAELTGGDCHGIYISNELWYSKPLELLSFGLYDSVNRAELSDILNREIPVGENILGLAVNAHADSVLGHLGAAVTAAVPEYVYTTIGMSLVKIGVEKYKEKPVTGMVQTLVGGMCMSSTLEYMSLSLFGAKSGHDYYNVVLNLLEMCQVPELVANPVATVLTPLVGIPLMFAASYFTAGAVTEKFFKYDPMKAANKVIEKKEKAKEKKKFNWQFWKKETAIKDKKPMETENGKNSP